VRAWEVTFAGPPFEALAPPGGRGGVISSRGSETLVRVERPEDLDALLDAVRASKGRLISVAPRRETLEDLYLREVGRG